MTKTGFSQAAFAPLAPIGPPACSAPPLPIPLTREGLEQIRRDGMEPFLEQCRETLGAQGPGQKFRLLSGRALGPEPKRLSLYRLRDEEACFLCRGLPAVDPESCYIKARKNGQTYYLEEHQAPAILGGSYEILYCMLGKELAGAVYDSGQTGPRRWQAIGLRSAGEQVRQTLWLEAF